MSETNRDSDKLYAYLDTSYLISAVFEENSEAAELLGSPSKYSLISSPLLIAEFFSFSKRVGISASDTDDALEGISWISPDPEELQTRITNVLTFGYLRGADCYHVACAWTISTSPSQLAFLTVDKDQKRIAAAVGFQAI